MNHTFRQVQALLLPTHSDLSALSGGSSPTASALFSSFTHSYAWCVIQLEKTSQSLEGALMHYRLHLSQQHAPSLLSLSRVGGYQGSPHPFLSRAPPPQDRRAALHAVLTGAKGVIGSVLEGLEREGRVEKGWWERRVQGDVVEDVLLLCVGLTLAMQRGEVETVRGLMEVLQRRAEQMRRHSQNQAEVHPLQPTVDATLSTLTLLIAHNSHHH